MSVLPSSLDENKKPKYVRKPIEFKKCDVKLPNLEAVKRPLSKSLDAVVDMEADCNEILKVVNDLKRGIMLETLSKERQIEYCNKIMEIVNR